MITKNSDKYREQIFLSSLVLLLKASFCAQHILNAGIKGHGLI